jgi:hypothetical protein
VPLDLGHHAARCLPALCLIAKVGVVPADLARRTTNRALEQILDLLLKNLIGRQPDRVVVVFGLQELIDLWICKGRIGAKVTTLEPAPIAGHDRPQHVLPTIGTMDIARTQRGAFQIAELIEHEYTPRVYELSPKGKAALIASGITPIHWVGERQFWHQLMVADIVMSFEIACKSRGLRFRHRKDIIGSAPLTFPTEISHQFPKHSDHYSGVLQPDELFAINDTYFILEADRHNEPITRPTLATSSYLRKILQYRAVLKSTSYKALIPNMLVLNITTSPTHADNIMAFMEAELAMSSSSMMFMGIDILGSRESYPQPLVELLDLPFRRVGHDNFIISQEV